MEYFKVLAPSIGVALIFFIAIRAIIHADRNERRVEDEYYAAEESEGEAVRERSAEEQAEVEADTAPRSTTHPGAKNAPE